MTFMRQVTYRMLLTCWFFITAALAAQEYRTIADLNGWWKFSIGDDQAWSKPSFNDSDWDGINAPGNWEDQGYYGYNGYAWYRKQVYLPEQAKGKSLYLAMGYIDDVDQVYFNGTLIGSSGSFPPYYRTAYNAHRLYAVPQELCNFNSGNTISVRVYDAQLGGGIMSGNLALVFKPGEMVPDLSLAGAWRFKAGDNREWAQPGTDDNGWSLLTVPGFWESQGYQHYDGFAWYRKSFTLPRNLSNQQLMMVFGAIDDLDEVYVNGVRIGGTGDIKDNFNDNYPGNEYREFRAYAIPANLLNTSKPNIVAVRVFDKYADGGIYRSPVGIITQQRYLQFWRKR